MTSFKWPALGITITLPHDTGQMVTALRNLRWIVGCAMRDVEDNYRQGSPHYKEMFKLAFSLYESLRVEGKICADMLSEDEDRFWRNALNLTDEDTK